MSRLLRSKRERANLWYSAGGKCQMCGRDLPPDWESDHITPFSISHRTNLHEMQAVCRGCNRKKGCMKARKHQGDVIELFTAIQAGIVPLPRFLNVDCICGGGKSIIPVIVAYYMIRKLGLADKIVWAVPRTSLRNQGAEAFLPGKLADRLLGHGLEIAENDNTANPCKGTAGYITSIQAIVADPDFHRKYFDLHRTILVVDEFHHIGKRTAYSKALTHLHERSRLTVPMSGYWSRHDGIQLDWMPYGMDGYLDQTNDREHRWIHYPLEVALCEKAIIPTHFVHLDAAGRYEMVISREPFEFGTLGRSRNAIFAALHSDFAKQLMEKCYQHWKIYRKHHPRSKLLVVCADVNQARMILKFIREELREEYADIATYTDDRPDATIDRFLKGSDIRVLVTVAMAYEGLDVPSITHLAILTHIRSEGWILQNLARAWRYDPDAGPWEGQVAHAFLPDDIPMKNCVSWIKDIQLRLAIDPPDGDMDGGGKGRDGDGGGDGRDAVFPLTSAVSRERASGLNGEVSLEDGELLRFCNEMIAKHELPLSSIQCRPLIEDVIRRFSPKADVLPPEGSEEEDGWDRFPWMPDFPARRGSEISPPPGILPVHTVSQRIQRYRLQVDEHVKVFAKGNGDAVKAINTELRIKFGPRAEWDEEQLREALSYLQSRYPRQCDV